MNLHPQWIPPGLIQSDQCHIQFWYKELIPLNMTFLKPGIIKKLRIIAFLFQACYCYCKWLYSLVQSQLALSFKNERDLSMNFQLWVHLRQEREVLTITWNLTVPTETIKCRLCFMKPSNSWYFRLFQKMQNLLQDIVTQESDYYCYSQWK